MIFRLIEAKSKQSAIFHSPRLNIKRFRIQIKQDITFTVGFFQFLLMFLNLLTVAAGQFDYEMGDNAGDCCGAADKRDMF